MVNIVCYLNYSVLLVVDLQVTLLTLCRTIRFLDEYHADFSRGLLNGEYD